MALNKTQTKAFNALQAAILASVAGYVFADAESVKPFVAENLVEVNADITNDDGHIAVRLIGNQSQGEQMPETSQTAAAPVAANKSAFEVETGVSMPATVRGRTSHMYPFDSLEVGQSFFVPNTAEKPNAAKSLASTVSGATARYAQEVPGETVVNRKGRTVPKTVETRKFVVKADKKGDVEGARVWRTA